MSHQARPCGGGATSYFDEKVEYWENSPLDGRIYDVNEAEKISSADSGGPGSDRQEVDGSPE